MPEPEQRNQPSRGRSRLEDEVLEILVRTDQPTSLRDHIRRKASRRRRARLSEATRSLPFIGTGIGPGTLLVGCLVTAFVSWSVRDSSELLARILAITSVGMLLAMYTVRYGRPGRANVKQWRGRDIDLSPAPPAWVEALRERFRRPPRR